MRSIDRILELAKEKGVKQSFINDLVHGYRGKVTEWKNGKSSPDENELEIIADYFNVSVGYLKGEEKKETPNVPEEVERRMKLVSKYVANLPEEDFQKALKMLQVFLDK